MINFNQDIFNAVVTTALESASQHPRWVNAIQRAAKELVENPYIEAVGDHLLIGSPSGNTYESNGICQCTAYTNGKACWHRAATQLVYRYNESVKNAAKQVKRERALVEINELF